MYTALTGFFDNRRHKFRVRNFEVPLDVLAFHSEEHLSQPFTCSVESTTTEVDITVDRLFDKALCFSQPSPAKKLTLFDLPNNKPQRTLSCALTDLKKLLAKNLVILDRNRNIHNQNLRRCTSARISMSAVVAC